MFEGVPEEEPALGAFWGGRANLQVQRRDEEVPSRVHFKISHTLRSPPGSPVREQSGLKATWPIVFNLRKEGNSDMCYNMDRRGGHYAQ